jgi:hypothetical protein
MKLYWPIIRPIVRYACETWVLKETFLKKNKLMIFERKVLRKIFSSTKEADGTNDELDKLIRHKYIVNHKGKR